MAKAEMLLITGYQRELTYRRSDGSFSAFGDQDEQGSLFLTAFVLKTFAQAKGLIYVDEAVLTDSTQWITERQRPDGSFESVGFVAHQELMGGVQGKDALTAYAAIALREAGETQAAGKAIRYLEGRLEATDDPYALTLIAYALELADSPVRQQAYDKLMATAEEDEDGLHWRGKGGPEPLPAPQMREARPTGLIEPTYDIEATGYGTLALIHHGDQVNASKAAKWLVAHRNAYGGYGSTQDTVVALQALTEFATLASADVDLTVSISAGDVKKEVRITPQNFDVTQVVEMPVGGQARLQAQGKGQAILQAVRRYNLPQPDQIKPVFDIKVDYGTTHVDVNDVVDVKVRLTFNPPEPIKAGMVVLDVSVPTGFAPVRESLERAVDGDPRLKRYDVAGRKVILYVEDMAPGESIEFSFEVRALYPVRAKGAVSQAYSYYTPEWKGEMVGAAMTVD